MRWAAPAAHKSGRGSDLPALPGHEIAFDRVGGPAAVGSGRVPGRQERPVVGRGAFTVPVALKQAARGGVGWRGPERGAEDGPGGDNQRPGHPRWRPRCPRVAGAGHGREAIRGHRHVRWPNTSPVVDDTPGTRQPQRALTAPDAGPAQGRARVIRGRQVVPHVTVGRPRTINRKPAHFTHGTIGTKGRLALCQKCSSTVTAVSWVISHRPPWLDSTMDSGALSS